MKKNRKNTDQSKDFTKPPSAFGQGIRRSKIITSIFFYNQFERDIWVGRVAKSVPVGSSVLDIGAGSGPYRLYFSHTTYKSHDFCQLKSEQLLGGHGYAEIDYVSDIKSIPVPDCSFDYILCTEVLEHVPEPIEAIREILRILKPGGIAFVSAPLGSGLHQQPFHFYGGYTPYFYRFAAEKFGGSIDSIEENGMFFRLFSQECVRFVKQSNPAKINSPIWIKLIWAPLWLINIPITISICLFAWLLRKYINVPEFTVGYHVQIKKNMVL